MYSALTAYSASPSSRHNPHRFLIMIYYATHLLMQEGPPKQLPFRDKRIPQHVTYAHKRSATIVENTDFYTLPESRKKRKVGILFLIANAPVSTASIPDHGSLSNAGLALAMELAMDELSQKFPFLSPNVPRCTGPNADAPLNGTVDKTNGNHDGSTATFHCKNGFRLNGTRSITCIAPRLGATSPAPNTAPQCTRK